MKKPLILASRSPRRIQILTDLGLEFTTAPSAFQELEHAANPEQLVLENAQGKAREVAQRHQNSIIIGVDTIGVTDQNCVLGKPRDRSHAKELIQSIAGTTHRVLSGICLIDTSTNKEISQVVTTTVTMSPLTESELEAYLDSNDWHDKAAAYAIQGRGALFVKSIQGDYFNIVGLPIFTLNLMLKEFGFNILKAD